jgi:hypothetical protein
MDSGVVQDWEVKKAKSETAIRFRVWDFVDYVRPPA